MRTTRLFISILLVTIATNGYGQIPGFEEGQSVLEVIKNNLFPNRNQEVIYIPVEYKEETGRIESWMSDLHSWATDLVSEDAYSVPVITRTILVEQAEVIFESDLEVENWMNTPFESGLAEEEMVVENWMVAPFESALAEEELIVEQWMITVSWN